MSESRTPTTDHLDRARQLVAAVLSDDVTDAGPDEDLRDYGLDSVRVMAVLDTLSERGVDIGADIDFADLVGNPTLARIGAALAAAEHIPTRAPVHGLPEQGEGS